MERCAGTVAVGFEPGAVIGALIDVKAVGKVKAHIADAVKKGAKVVTDGADRWDDRHGHHQGGELWPGRPARPLQDRCRGNQVANGAPTLPSPLAGEGPGRRPQSYGLEVRSGLPVSRSTGTETCSWMMSHRPRTFL